MKVSCKSAERGTLNQTNLVKGGPAEAETIASSSMLALRPQLLARRSWWGKRTMPGWARWASCWGRGNAMLSWRNVPDISPHWPSLAACCWLSASRARGPWRSERQPQYLLNCFHESTGWGSITLKKTTNTLLQPLLGRLKSLIYFGFSVFLYHFYGFEQRAVARLLGTWVESCECVPGWISNCSFKCYTITSESWAGVFQSASWWRATDWVILARQDLK